MVPTFFGELDAQLEVVDPAPESTYQQEMASLYVRCTWYTGMLWWRKKREETLEFVIHHRAVFWPGVPFQKATPGLHIQLESILTAHHARNAALRDAQI